MTAQINDIMIYQGQEFALAGIEHEPLFEPQQHQLLPRSISTACWRGFYCSYRIAASQLQLDQLFIGFNDSDAAQAKAGNGTTLQGIVPVYDTREHCFRYDHLALPIMYTGGLIIGAGFIRELYVHMGFHPAWKYTSVYELIFQGGLLVEAFDRSDEMATLRAHLRQQPLSPGSRAPQQEIRAWIEQTFERRYQR